MNKLQGWPRNKIMVVVYSNPQSGAEIYQCKDNGLFYWSDVLGVFESDNLENLIKEEKKLDARMGWN
jgi:hypothetical protein